METHASALAKSLLHGWLCRLWLVLATLAVTVPGAEAMEIKLRAQLVWGTNDEQPKSGDAREVGTKLKEKLGRVFKWKNYFLIKDQSCTVKSGEARRVKMSDKCEIELQVVDDFTLEVRLFGEGTLLKTVRQPLQALRQGELAVLAGDSKERHGDAWFVVLSAPKR